MTNKLTYSQDYAAREYLLDLRELAREYADGDESVYTDPSQIILRACYLRQERTRHAREIRKDEDEQ